MKSLLIAIKPKWCAKIMNGDKTIEVRKNKALATAIQKLIDKYGYADIYVYCTKEGKVPLVYNKILQKCTYGGNYGSIKDVFNELNCKVVFKFRCYKTNCIWKTTTNIWTYGSDLEPNFYKESCLNDIELDRYFKPTKIGFGKVYGYAIHINNLEIFDKPKELSEFRHVCELKNCKAKDKDCWYCGKHTRLTKAPQNMVYIEVTENE